MLYNEDVSSAARACGVPPLLGPRPASAAGPQTAARGHEPGSIMIIIMMMIIMMILVIIIIMITMIMMIVIRIIIMVQTIVMIND